MRAVAKETIIDIFSTLFRKSQILIYWIWAIKTYIQSIRKTLITLELLDGFTSYKDPRVARERGFPAPSVGKRPLVVVIILYGGRK